MKKKLKSKIQQLARQILSQDKLEDTSAMLESTRELYELLTVLNYLETQILGEEEEVKTPEVESMDSKSFREQNWFREPEPLPVPENNEEIIEPVMEKIKDLVAQMPQESQEVDQLLEEVLPVRKAWKDEAEEISKDYGDLPVFERKPAEPSMSSQTITQPKANGGASHIQEMDRPRSLNDKLHRGLHIGLNDRLAFIKHLFDGRTQDYKRVLSQISSMESYEEAETFIKGKVKPDYNYWLNKDEYADRFMTIVEKSFN
ncbi:hypothetical protein [Aureitalea marina]|uniref:Uncharacterized protein n=1 Tax=Aureitalea marina TaxID=930804 RepID=A0A2S7KS05_9FLAO|nr:hypothetical protein [Aureitalea marina]PQB05409.1 hypothetical protein BST85_11295 [Aureitalea marina]